MCVVVAVVSVLGLGLPVISIVVIATVKIVMVFATLTTVGM